MAIADSLRFYKLRIIILKMNEVIRLSMFGDMGELGVNPAKISDSLTSDSGLTEDELVDLIVRKNVEVLFQNKKLFEFIEFYNFANRREILDSYAERYFTEENFLSDDIPAEFVDYINSICCKSGHSRIFGAVRSGHIICIKKIFASDKKNFVEYSKSSLYREAFVSGKTEVLDCIFDLGFKPTKSIMEQAINTAAGRMTDSLEWLLKKNCPIDSSVFAKILETNNVGLMKHCFFNGSGSGPADSDSTQGKYPIMNTALTEFLFDFMEMDHVVSKEMIEIMLSLGGKWGSEGWYKFNNKYFSRFAELNLLTLDFAKYLISVDCPTNGIFETLVSQENYREIFVWYSSVAGDKSWIT
jgi:hypothetical protein